MQSPLLRHIGIVAIWAIAILIVFVVGLKIFGMWYDEWSGFNASWDLSGGGYCNIGILPIVGEIAIYDYSQEYLSEEGGAYTLAVADDVVGYLRAMEADPYIEGVLVRIDSGGGSPVASEVITNALKHSFLPTAAVIREIGTSGAYLAATGADFIFASAYSDVGSIGITMSYLENSRQNETEGLRYVSLASGELKDAGNPNKPLTAEERALFERDLALSHEYFVTQVAENRGLPREDVEVLADGSSMMGEQALENGLIDAVGDQEAARFWFAEELGLSPEEVVFCE